MNRRKLAFSSLKQKFLVVLRGGKKQLSSGAGVRLPALKNESKGGKSLRYVLSCGRVGSIYFLGILRAFF